MGFSWVPNNVKDAIVFHPLYEELGAESLACFVEGVVLNQSIEVFNTINSSLQIVRFHLLKTQF